MDLKRLLFLVGCFVFAAISLKAQEGSGYLIRGLALDEQKVPLGKATVELRSAKDSAVVKTTITDKTGLYSIAGVDHGSYFVRISMVGFDALMSPAFELAGSSVERSMDTMVLHPASKELGSVVVRAQPAPVERKLDRVVYNIENSVASEGSTALEVISRLPGVQVTSDGGVSLAGRQDVKIFIDGKPTNLSDEDLANLLRGTPSASIQRVEVMSNPPAKYDAAGSGGIINIVRKQNRKAGINGSVTGGVGEGEYTRYNGGANLSYRTADCNLYANMTYVHNKGILATNVVSDVLNPDNTLNLQQLTATRIVRSTSTYAPYAGIEFNLSPRTTLGVSGIANFQDQKINTESDLRQLDSGVESTGSTLYNNLYHDHPYNYTISSHFAHRVDSTGGEFSVDLDYSDYCNKPEQAIGNELFDPNGGFLEDSLSLLDQIRHLHIYSVKADFSKLLRGGYRFEAGLKSSYVDVNSDDRYYNLPGGSYVYDSSLSNNFINQENINAAYVNLNKQFKKLTAQIGLRAEHTSNKADQTNNGIDIRQNYVKLFPSAFFDYKLNDDNVLNFKAGRRIDRPAYSDMNPFRRPLSATLYFEGNPNLQPQTATNLELGYSFQNAFYITAGYEVYKNFIATLPFPDPDKVTQTRMPSNVNGTKSYNLEFGYSKKLLRWWTPDYDVEIYRQTSHGSVNGVDVENPGVLSVDFTLNNSFSLGKDLTAEVNYRFVGRHRVVSTTFGGYSLLNLGLKKQIIHGKATITLNANNILQTENETSTYQYGDLYQSWRVHYYSRLVALSFSYRFGRGKAMKAREAGSVEEQQRTRL